MMLSLVTVTRCGSSSKDCSASLHAANVAGQHERNSASVAVTHCAGNAELSGTTDFAGAADNGTRPHLAGKERRRRRPAPEGFHTVAALAASGDPGRSSLYRAIQTGQLPAHKWRGRLVISDSDYRAFLAVTPLQRDGTDISEAKVRHDD